MNLLGLVLLPLLVQPSGPLADREVKSYTISQQKKILTVSSDSRAGESHEFMKITLEAAEDPGGAAIWNDRLIITLPKSAVLLVCSLLQKKVLSRQSLPDFPSPHGAAYDPQGRLWILSANSLAEIQFTSDGHFNPIHHRGDFSDPHHLLVLPNGHFYIAENGPPPVVKVLDSKLNLLETTSLQQPAKGLMINPTGGPVCLFEKAAPLPLKPIPVPSKSAAPPGG